MQTKAKPATDERVTRVGEGILATLQFLVNDRVQKKHKGRAPVDFWCLGFSDAEISLAIRDSAHHPTTNGRTTNGWCGRQLTALGKAKRVFRKKVNGTWIYVPLEYVPDKLRPKAKEQQFNSKDEYEVGKLLS